MKLRYLLLYIFLIVSVFNFNASAQTLSSPGAIKKNKNLKFYVAVGSTLSIIEANRLTQNNPRNCLNIRACVVLNNKFRILAETAYHKYDQSPTWNNIQWNNYEVDFHYIGHFEESTTGIYLLTGIGIQKWGGLFTGINDYAHFATNIFPDSRHDYTWGTLNMGFGVEKDFNKLGMFGEFKLRARKKNDFTVENIIDVVYTFGLRYNFDFNYTITKANENGTNRTHFKYNHHKKSAASKKSENKLPSDKYHWFPKK